MTRGPGGLSPAQRARLCELGRIVRFGVVGVSATGVHTLVALAIAAGGGLAAQIAHVAGFLAAVPVSFLGHYHFTFKSRANYGPAVRRFFAVALAAFLASMILLETLTRLTRWDVAATILVSVLVIPGLSYLINRAFVFDVGERGEREP